MLHLIAILGLGIAQLPNLMDGELRDGSAIAGCYITEITNDALRKTPQWKSPSDNPPVPALQAMKIAGKVVDQMEQGHKDWETKWARHLDRLELVPASDDRWYWLVNYKWNPTHGDLGGMAPHVTIGVLMDGSVVMPKPVPTPPQPGASNK